MVHDDLIHSKITRYLETKRALLEAELRHRLADTYLDRVTYEAKEGGDGTKEEHQEFSWFGDQLVFLDYLRARAARSHKKPIIVIGDSGLGKTWLLLRSWLELAVRWPDNRLLPVFLRLRGETLTLDKEALQFLASLSPEKRRRYEERLSADPVEDLRKWVTKETGLAPEELAGVSVILMLDGLNEMPPEGQKNLFLALKVGFPDALWVISGQPQVVDGVEEIKRNTVEGGWDFFHVQPVTRPRLESYLKALLPEDSDWEAVEDYFEKLSQGIWRNPRYLEKICENVRAHPLNSERWPVNLGEIFDQAVGATLKRYLNEAGVDGVGLAERTSLHKLLLGCMGIYEMLSGGIPLRWDMHEGDDSVWVWLQGFASAGIFADPVWEHEAKRLQARGPWGFTESARIVFDHDTTRDYAVAFLVCFLLGEWAPGKYRGFREWLELALIAHPELGKSLRMALSMGKELHPTLDVDLYFTEESWFLNAYAAWHPHVRKWLIAGLQHACRRRDVVEALAPVVHVPDVMAALLDWIDDEEEDFCISVIMALEPVAAKDAILSALHGCLMDNRSSVRNAVVRVLASAATEPNARSTLIKWLEDEDYEVNEAAFMALTPLAAEPDVMAVLISKTGHERHFVRKHATKALNQVICMPMARSALLGRLQDDDFIVRLVTVHTLASAAGEDDVTAALLGRLADKEGDVRTAVVHALKPYVDRPVVAAALLGRTADEDECVRRAAVEALRPVANQPAVIAALLGRLEDKEVGIRIAAIKALKRVVGKSAVTAVLLGQLADKEAEVRRAALEILCPLANQPAVKAALLNQIEDEDWVVRSDSIKALKQVVGESVVTTALLGRLEDKNEITRKAAVEALRRVVGEHQEAATPLDWIEDTNGSMHYAAVGTLRPVVAEPAVTASILGWIEDGNESIRYAAVETLKPVVAEPAVMPAILGRLEDKNESVRFAAVQALAAVVTEPAVIPALLGRLEDTNESVRIAAVEALKPVVTEPAVMPAILGRLEDTNESERFAAVQALAAVVTEPAVIPALLGRLEDKDESVRIAAVKALKPVVAEPAVMPAILGRIKDKNRSVRIAAVRALAAVVTEPAVMPALLGRFEDKDESVRFAAVAVLAPAVHNHLVSAALVKRLEDDDPEVRGFTAYALQSIAGEPGIMTALVRLIHDSTDGVVSSAIRVLTPFAGDPLVAASLAYWLGYWDEYRVKEVDDALMQTLAKDYADAPKSVLHHFLLSYFEKRNALSSRPIASSFGIIRPRDFKEVLHSLVHSLFTSLHPKIYAGLHWLRHEAKGDRDPDQFLRKLYKFMPSLGSAIDLSDFHGENIPPLFNAGTYALAVLRKMRDVFGGDLNTSQKSHVVALFKAQVCNWCGFAAEDAIGVWLAPLQDERIDFGVLPSSENDNKHVLGDWEIFHDGMMQIVRNALSFAHKKVRISLLTDPESDPAILITDDGPGIKPEEVECCFTPWTSRPEKGGEGIGLRFAFPYKLGLMGFSLFVRDNEQQWHWIVSDDGRQMRPEARRRNPLSNPPMNDPRLDQCLFARGAAFLIVQS